MDHQGEQSCLTHLRAATATDGDEPPAFTSGLERLGGVTVDNTAARRLATRPALALRQVDDLTVLRTQHRFLLTTVLYTQTATAAQRFSVYWHRTAFKLTLFCFV